MPFGKMHSRNPQIIEYANKIGRTPSALAMKLTNIASFDPAITSTGRSGLTGASKADNTMWDEMVSSWETFAIEADIAEKNLDITESNDIFDIETNTDIEETDYTGKTKTTQTETRIGQNFFRRAVLSAYNCKCCISGLPIQQLLIASHIVPWKDNVNNRLNPKNGLCLSMIHDKAFDAGMITLTKELTVKVAENQFKADPFYIKTILQYEGKQIFLPKKFHPDSDFLSYHRTHIFKGVLS
jgi:predicted restriction endonuclease